MDAVRQRTSYTDLQQWPEDGRRYELYDGEVFVVPAPLPRHQIVALNIADLFRAHAEVHGGRALVSPIDIVFSEYDVVQPDVVWFGRSRQHLVKLDEPIRSAPDIAVEVLSPGTAATDRGKKMVMFARYGVPEYWLVDPKGGTIEVHHLEGARYQLVQVASRQEHVRSTAYPELKFAAEEAFRDLERS